MNKRSDEMSDDYSDSITPNTMHDLGWPCLRQFCIVLENRVGSLADLLRVVESFDVRVLALNVIDSADVAVVRLIFNNSDRAREKLELSAIHFSESDVIGIEVPDHDTPLASICMAMMKAEVNIHHAFPLLYRRHGHGVLVMFVDDIDVATRLLRESGLTLVTESMLRDLDDWQ